MARMGGLSPIRVAHCLLRRPRPSLIAILAIVALAVPPSAIVARPSAAIDVTTTVDEWNEGDDCSLREAIQAANTDAAFGGCTAGSGADVIDLPAGTYTLGRAGVDDDTNATGDLDLNSDITINGAGQTTTVIDGDELDRVLHVLGSTVELNQLTITGGQAPAGAPGADGSSPGEDGEDGGPGASGGGIYNLGTLTLNRCSVSSNRTGSGGSGGEGAAGADGSSSSFAGGKGGDGGWAGSGGDGGGIYNEGTLTLNSSTVEDNQTGTTAVCGDGGRGGDGYQGAPSGVGGGGEGGSGGGGGRGGRGGGIYSTGPVDLNDSILRGNRCGDGTPGCDGGAGGDGGVGFSGLAGGKGGDGGAGGEGGRGGSGSDGGGIYSEGELLVVRCLITQNRAGSGGPGGMPGTGGQGGDGGDATGSGSYAGRGGAGGVGGEGCFGTEGGSGGGIWTVGDLRLTLSEVSANRAGDSGSLCDGGQGGAGGNGGENPSGYPGTGGDGGRGGVTALPGGGGRGGGIWVVPYGDVYVLSDSSVSGNSAGNGSQGGNGGQGGNAGYGGSPGGAPGSNGDGTDTIGSPSGGSGGGLYIEDGGSVTIEGCAISGNAAGDGRAGGHGGNSGATPGTMTGTGGQGGRGGSGGSGGGMLAGITTVHLVNSTFSGNRAGNGAVGGDGGTGPAGDGEPGDGGNGGAGGGMVIYGRASAYNCTISGNRATGSVGQPGTGSTQGQAGSPGQGGGVYNHSAEYFTLAHTLFGDNAALGVGQDCSGTFESEDYNLIESIGSCTLTGDTDHNVVGEDPDLGSLADNGGPTETQALLPGSPALDGGDAICYDPEDNPLSVDQRGKGRPVDGDDNGSLLCDIGAVEMQGTFSLAVELDGGGSGVVTSQPSGIDCGLDCSETYFDGTVVTLTAAADTGSQLVSWDGACSGTEQVCAVSVIQNLTVTVTFELDLARVFLPIILKE